MSRGILRLRPPNVQGLSLGRMTASNLSRPVQLFGFHLRHTFTTSGCQWAPKNHRVSQNILKSGHKPPLPYKSPFDAYMEQLASRASPTLLYEAPSHAFYKTGWLLLGGFCLTWATINFNNHYLHPLDGTPTYVPIIIGAVSVGMAFGAGWSFLKVRLSSLNE